MMIKILFTVSLMVWLTACNSHPPKPPVPSDRLPYIQINRFIPVSQEI